jgi:hypothetical protein
MPNRHRGDTGILALPIPDPDARRWSKPHCGTLYTRYPLYRRVGVRQGRSRREQNISPHQVSNPPARCHSPYRRRYSGPRRPSYNRGNTKAPTIRNKHFTCPALSPVRRYLIKLNCILFLSQYFRKHCEC